MLYMYKHLAESIKENDNKQFISRAELDKYNAYETTCRRKTDTYTKSELQSFVDEFDNVTETVKDSCLIISDTKKSFVSNIRISGKTIQNRNDLSDIQSVGDKLEDGRYEIPIVCVGENLFNGEYVFGYLPGGSTTGDLVTDAEGDYRSTLFIKAKPNTYYTKSLNNRSVWHFYRDDLSYIGNIYDGNPTTIITPIETSFIRVYYNNGGIDTIGNIDELMIVEGKELPKDYVPYEEHRLNIISDVPLEGIEGFNDEIIYKDGVWGISKKIKESELTSDSNKYKWTIVDRGNGFVDVRFTNFNYNDNVFLNVGICDKLQRKVGWDDNSEGIWVDHNIILTLSTTKATTNTIMEWLDKNRPKIKYPIEEPVFIPLPENQQVKLKTFNNKTQIYFDCFVDGIIACDIVKTRKSLINSTVDMIRLLSKELDEIEYNKDCLHSTISTDKRVTTIEKTENGYLNNIVIKGKSLVNLSDTYNELDWLNSTPTIHGYSRENNYFKIDFDSTEATTNTYLNDNTISIKAGKRYTYIVEIKDNELISGARVELFPYMWENAINKSRSEYIKTGEEGFIVFAFDAIADMKFMFMYRHKNQNGLGSYKVGQIMVLEGDYTDQLIPYFEGLKSVGDVSNKIVLRTENENLLPDKVYDSSYWCVSLTGTGQCLSLSTNLEQRSITLKSYVDCDTYAIFNNPINIYNNQDATILSLKPNTKYKFSYNATSTHDDVEMYIIRYNRLNGQHRGYVPMLRLSGSSVIGYKEIEFKTGADPENITIRFDVNVGGATLTIKDLMITEVTNDSTDYIEYECDEKQLLYKNSDGEWETPILRAIPNNVCDTIEKHADGKYYYHKRCEQLLFDGSSDEGWFKESNSSHETVNVYGVNIVNLPIVVAKEYNCILCDKLKNTDVWYIDEEGVAYYGNSTHNNNLKIGIYKSKIGDNTLSQYLTSNPISIIFKLDREEIYECTPIDLQTYSNNTTLSIETGPILPTIEMEVLNDIGSIVNNLQSKISVLENEITNNINFDNVTILNSMYSADSASFYYNINSISREIHQSNDLHKNDIYIIIKNIIISNTEDISKEYLESIIDFYTMTDNISIELADELFALLHDYMA